MSTTELTSQTELIEGFHFDAPSLNVPVNIAPAGKPARFVHHEARFPTLEELKQRERLSKYEVVEVSRNEDAIRADDEKANAYLFKQVGVAATGYLFEKVPADVTDPKAVREFKRERAAERRKTSEWLHKIPGGHQRAVLQALHAFNARPEYNEDDEWCDMSADDNAPVLIEVEVGTGAQPDYVLTFELRAPEEAEVSRYKRNVAEVRSAKGTRKQQQRIVTNIDAGVEAFDLLFQRVTGGAVENRPSAEADKATMLKAINPIIKRVVAQAVMGRHDADLSD